MFKVSELVSHVHEVVYSTSLFPYTLMEDTYFSTKVSIRIKVAVPHLGKLMINRFYNTLENQVLTKAYHQKILIVSCARISPQYEVRPSIICKNITIFEHGQK